MSFRSEVRVWLEENCPASCRGPGEVPGGGTRVPMGHQTPHVAAEVGSARSPVSMTLVYAKNGQSREVLASENHVCHHTCSVGRAQTFEILPH